MLLDIPDIKGHERETLYIIGNGFDKAHNLKTSYNHFHDWLLKNGHKVFVDTIEGIANTLDKKKLTKKKLAISLLWTDFEAALGRIDASTALEWLQEEFGKVYDNPEAKEKAIEKVRKTVDDVEPLMKKWAESIDVSEVECLYNLNKESRYLTFNYTLTLEKQYNISKHILHIHGKVKDENKPYEKDEKLIVGCKEDQTRTPFNLDLRRRRVETALNREFNRFNKPSDQLMENDLSFFNSLSDITRVVVLGHSLSDIDNKYLQQVVLSVGEDAHWHFFTYNDKDYKRVNKFLGSLDGKLANNVKFISNIGIKSENEEDTKTLDADDLTQLDVELIKKIKSIEKNGKIPHSEASGGIINRCLPNYILAADKEHNEYYCGIDGLDKKSITQEHFEKAIKEIQSVARSLAKLEKAEYVKFVSKKNEPLTELIMMSFYDRMGEKLDFSPVPIPEDIVLTISEDSQLSAEVDKDLYDLLDTDTDLYDMIR